MKLKYYLFAIAIFFFTTAQAQNVPSKWSHKVVNPTVEIGGEIELVFTAVIPDKYLVYSNNYDCPNGGPLPAEFLYNLDSTYELVGSPLAVGDEEVFDDIFECNIKEFHTKAEFRQKIKITNSNSSISGILEYQMCAPTGLCVLHKYEFTVENLVVSEKKN